MKLKFYSIVNTVSLLDGLIFSFLHCDIFCRSFSVSKKERNDSRIEAKKKDYTNRSGYTMYLYLTSIQVLSRINFKSLITNYVTIKLKNYKVQAPNEL